MTRIVFASAWNICVLIAIVFLAIKTPRLVSDAEIVGDQIIWIGITTGQFMIFLGIVALFQTMMHALNGLHRALTQRARDQFDATRGDRIAYWKNRFSRAAFQLRHGARTIGLGADSRRQFAELISGPDCAELAALLDAVESKNAR